MSVRFIMDARVREGGVDDLRTAYSALRARVAEEPGLVSHQLCEVIDDPERWMVISEFENLEAAQRWNQSQDHARLTVAMRACFTSGQSITLELRDGS